MKQRIASTANGSSLRLAADIGGTFTDVAAFDERTGKLTFGKALSTPQRLVEGINAGVEKAGSDYKSAGLFLHGSTIAINTILERKGAKTALLITEGFRDVYEIGRINRPDAYNLFFRKHKPLVERALRFEVKERVLADGEVETVEEVEHMPSHLDRSLGSGRNVGAHHAIKRRIWAQALPKRHPSQAAFTAVTECASITTITTKCAT
jgi:N-methylhydantoinase A